MIDYPPLGSESRFVGSASNVFSGVIYFITPLLRIFQKGLVTLLMICLMATSPRSASRVIGITLVRYVWISSCPCMRTKSFLAVLALGLGSTNCTLNILTKSM